MLRVGSYLDAKIIAKNVGDSSSIIMLSTEFTIRLK